jgi:hypothetical protein
LRQGRTTIGSADVGPRCLRSLGLPQMSGPRWVSDMLRRLVSVAEAKVRAGDAGTRRQCCRPNKSLQPPRRTTRAAHGNGLARLAAERQP